MLPRPASKTGHDASCQADDEPEPVTALKRRGTDVADDPSEFAVLAPDILNRDPGVVVSYARDGVSRKTTVFRDTPLDQNTDNNFREIMRDPAVSESRLCVLSVSRRLVGVLEANWAA